MSKTYRKNYLSQWQKAKGKKQLVQLGKIKPYACDDRKNSASFEKLSTKKVKQKDGSTDYYYHSKFLGNYFTYKDFLKDYPNFI